MSINPPLVKLSDGRLLRWEPALYNNGYQADLDDAGRYTVRRTRPRARTWYLRLNGEVLSEFNNPVIAMVSLGTIF